MFMVKTNNLYAQNLFFWLIKLFKFASADKTQEFILAQTLEKVEAGINFLNRPVNDIYFLMYDIYCTKMN